jgi:streptogramin lyase
VPRKSTLAGALVAASLLAGCGGGGSGSSLPSAPAQTAKAPGHGSKHRIKATIRISIPRRKHHRRVKIHGHYISPATQSIEISVTPQGGTATSYNANLTTALNPECSHSLISPLICTVTLELGPGDYTGTFTTYDGPLSGGGGSTDPATGDALSAAQSVPFTISAGLANQINIALDGIPTGITFVPAANSTLNGSVGSGFTSARCGSVNGNAEQVSVFGVDAGGNYILGPGQPQSKLESSNTALIAVASPAPASPNAFTIAHPITASALAPVSLTASVVPASDSGGTTQTASTNVTVQGGTGFCGFITEYAIPERSSPGAIAVGNDAMYFADFRQNIGRITTAGVISGQTLTDYPNGIAPDSSGNMWLTEYDGAIAERAADGTVTETQTGLSAQQEPYGIAVAPNGTVWITELFGFNVDSFVGGVLSQHAVPHLGSYLGGIAYGADGNLWFADGANIVQMTTSGVTQAFPTHGQVQQVTNGPNGNVWFTDGTANKVGEVTPGGVVTEFDLLPGAGPVGIGAGPDGNMWVTELSSNKIASITTDGVVREFPIPTANSNPIGIVGGPDGNIWFTECTPGKIARLQ